MAVVENNVIAKSLNSVYFSPATITVGEVTGDTANYVEFQLPSDTDLWVGRHIYIEFLENNIDRQDVNSIVWSYWVSPRILTTLNVNSTDTNFVGCTPVNVSDNFMGENMLPVSSANIYFKRNSSGQYIVHFNKRSHSIIELDNEPEVYSTHQGTKTSYINSGCKWACYIV